MPAMMNMAYGMEVMHTKDKITFFSELNDALRRVYLDGRKPTQLVLDDPTYAGYSTGHWEGDTLVVDTVALRDNTYIEGFTPHSDQMTIKERIRFLPNGLLEDRITVTDPKALAGAVGDGEDLSQGRQGRRPAPRVRVRGGDGAREVARLTARAPAAPRSSATCWCRDRRPWTRGSPRRWPSAVRSCTRRA